MTREEILNLDKPSEGEQVEWLEKQGILQITSLYRNPQYGSRYESLAECAFRLMEECDIIEYYHACYNLWERSGPTPEGPLCESGVWICFMNAIEKIQAALLAEGEGK
jgi:hypothetical protein